MTATRLPAEVIDMFLWHLPDACAACAVHQGPDMVYKETLRACTLVCHFWNPLATAHLFREVMFSFSYCDPSSPGVAPTTSYRVRRVEWPTWRHDSYSMYINPFPHGIKTLDHFLKFLENKPHIAPLIESLFIQGFSPFDPSRTLAEPLYVTPETFAGVINILPRLRNLELVDVAVGPWALSSSPSDLAIRRTISRLAVYYTRNIQSTDRCELHTGADVFRLLSCFRHVEIVNFIPDISESDEALPELDQDVRSNVGMLIFEMGGCPPPRDLIQCLERHPEFAKGIRGLSILMKNSEDRHTTRDFLTIRTVCPSLDILKFRTEFDIYQKAFHVPFLAPSATLSTLVFEIDFWTRSGDSEGDADYVTANKEALKISRETHPSLHTLSIDITVRESLFSRAPTPGQSEYTGDLETTQAPWRLKESHAKSFAPNPLDAALNKLVDNVQFKRILLHCEVRSEFPGNPEPGKEVLRHIFPELVKRNGVELDAVWIQGELWSSQWLD